MTGARKKSTPGWARLAHFHSADYPRATFLKKLLQLANLSCYDADINWPWNVRRATHLLAKAEQSGKQRASKNGKK